MVKADQNDIVEGSFFINLTTICKKSWTEIWHRVPFKRFGKQKRSQEAGENGNNHRNFQEEYLQNDQSEITRARFNPRILVKDV